MSVSCEQQGKVFVITSTEKPNAKAFVHYDKEKSLDKKWCVRFYHTKGNSHYFSEYHKCLDFLKKRGYK